MGHAALGLLGNGMGILESALNGVVFKNGVGTAKVVGDINHICGHSNGMGA